jgi:hypothetical protein
MPAPIRDAAREPFGARAVIYCLLLDKDPGLRERQLALLQDRADKDVYALTRRLMPQMNTLGMRFRLPVIDIAMPALKQLSHSQCTPFLNNLAALINMDARVDLFEWSLQKILSRHLDGHFEKPSPAAVKYRETGQLTREIEIVLSAVAHAGAASRHNAQAAFDASVSRLAPTGLTLLAKDQITTADMDQALGKLDLLAPAAKSRLLTACAVSIWHDQKATAAEFELLRAFASVLDYPLPPGVAPAGRLAGDSDAKA